MNETTLKKPAAPSEEEAAKQSQVKEFLKRLFKNKLAVTGGIIFLIICLLAIFAPLLTPYDYMAVDVPNKYLRPSMEHLLGTDQYGRDIFTRILYGGRWSLSLGISATLISTVLGIVIGSLAGYFGGIVDNVVMRIVDILQCIPGILMTICIATVLGGGTIDTVIALAFGGIWGTARMLRGQILTVREQEYVEAAKATNNPKLRIILKHVLPNAIQPTIISACMGVGGTITMVSGLSFLGLGIQAPIPEWGAMMSDGRAFLRYYPNMLLGPAIMIALTVLSISLFGDGLRDAMDPRLKD